MQFLARGAGYTIFLSPTSATFVLQCHARVGEPALPGRQPFSAESAIIRMDLAGASQAAAMEPRNKLPGITNYLIGNIRTKWPTKLPTYAQTRTRNVYPGIDLIYYGTQGQLEYDFVLAPGADPSRIRMTFAGATPLIDKSGDLVLPLAVQDAQSDVRFHKPVLYQLVDGVRQPVSGGFTIAAGSHEVRFHVNSYDHTRELVIDPVLAYSSYLGGSQYPSQINAMALNATGNIYVTGVTGALKIGRASCRERV